jgi:hypothetical protein
VTIAATRENTPGSDPTWLIPLRRDSTTSKASHMARPEPLKHRHHTVPRFHLKRFCNERGQLMRVPLDGKKLHLVSVGDATVEKDFYLVELEDGTSTDTVEDHLSLIEGNAAGAVRALVDERVWPIPDSVRQSIAWWAASQALRTSTQRRSHAELADLLLKLKIGVQGKPGVRDGLRAQYGREPTEAEVEELWATVSDFDSYEVTPHPNASLRIMTKMVPKTAAMFQARAFSLVYFERKTLITCDNPVYLAPAPDHPEGMGIGLVTAGEILIPLARQVALVLGEFGGEDTRHCGTTATARMFNQALADNAHQAVFHHPDDDPLAGIDLPQPGQRVTGGYEQIKSMVFPESIAAPGQTPESDG